MACPIAEFRRYTRFSRHHRYLRQTRALHVRRFYRAERQRMPNHLLQWEAIRWAKTNGCTTYTILGSAG